MEELQKQLYKMLELSYQLDNINGLIYVLREALRIRENDIMDDHYTMASAYISNLVMDFERDFDELMDHMFQALHHLECHTV